VLALRGKNQSFQKKFRNSVLGWTVPYWGGTKKAGEAPSIKIARCRDVREEIPQDETRAARAPINQDKPFAIRALSTS